MVYICRNSVKTPKLAEMRNSNVISEKRNSKKKVTLEKLCLIVAILSVWDSAIGIIIC